jgi:1-acyl-sn-glycerol-3-phosphate acyltransferase
MTAVDTQLAGHSLPSRLFYRFARTLVIVFCRVWFRLTSEGREHVPPTGPYVLAPVHRSNVDILVASVATTRRLRYMGKDSLWRRQPFRWLLSALGGFPVTRGTADREALIRGISVLVDGEPLVLYPEGERKSGPIVQPLFDGAVYVASKAGVPIVPMGIGGTERVMPRGSKFVRPARVHVVIGPPIMPPVAADGARVPRAAIKQVTEELHEELQRLFDLAQVRC